MTVCYVVVFKHQCPTVFGKIRKQKGLKEHKNTALQMTVEGSSQDEGANMLHKPGLLAFLNKYFLPDLCTILFQLSPTVYHTV